MKTSTVALLLLVVGLCWGHEQEDQEEAVVEDVNTDDVIQVQFTGWKDCLNYLYEWNGGVTC